jgi:hypothetical protein
VRTAVLTREESTDQGTFGRLVADGLTLFTGELPWRENAPNVSCIPAGTYKAAWTFSPAFKRMMYLILPVEGRSGIRIHSANMMGDKAMGFRSHLNGCIALGKRIGWMAKQKAVLLSAPAVTELENFFDREAFELEVRDV